MPVQQQINLYRHFASQGEASCSARQIAVAGGVALGAFILLGVVISAFNVRLESQLKQVKRESKHIAQELQHARLGNEDIINRELDSLRHSIKGRQAMLRQLENSADEHQVTFSQRLEGLGRQNVKGLWLDTITLTGGGRFLSLHGETTASELVPGYLKKLASDEVFNGLRFNVLKIQSSEEKTKQALLFEVTALPDMQEKGNS